MKIVSRRMKRGLLLRDGVIVVVLLLLERFLVLVLLALVVLVWVFFLHMLWYGTILLHMYG